MARVALLIGTGKYADGLKADGWQRLAFEIWDHPDMQIRDFSQDLSTLPIMPANLKIERFVDKFEWGQRVW
jgi:hypothetical protein